MTSTPPSRPRSANPRHIPSPLAEASLKQGDSSLAMPSPSTPRNVVSPTSPATPPPNKSKARDLLRKHYGLGVGPPPAGGSSAAASSKDPMNLDSPAFDAKSYYEQLITTSSLQSLLRKENEMLTEISELESERQSLVYNHHHELIAASDTISAVKKRADGLDADLDLLKAAFSEISRLGAEVRLEE